ncbi:MAG TPA: hypothetical protein VFQ53_12495 [Kofleriaceae bacterium]|nr:hypothetical protein [Kofleriaceae bacterium]
MLTRSALLQPTIDLLSGAERAAFVAARWREQFAYIERHRVAYWQARFRDHRVDEHAFDRLPPLTREELRDLSPWAFVPDDVRTQLRRAYGTSGTTGRPLSFFWTDGDWNAMADTFARMIERDRPAGEVIALNGYHQGHVAGQVYHSAIGRIGGVSIPRHYLFDDEAATLDQLRMFRCNTIILAERSDLLKNGKTIVALLQHSPKFFAELGIRWWLGSTSTFTAETRRIARDQGVTAITNLYGSAEFGALAVSCRVEPTHYHTAMGHAFVEIVDAQGRHVRSGERGRVVVSLLSSLDARGELAPRAGSQLLRIDNSDEATYIDEPCACGLASPRLHGIARRKR